MWKLSVALRKKLSMRKPAVAAGQMIDANMRDSMEGRDSMGDDDLDAMLAKMREDDDDDEEFAKAHGMTTAAVAESNVLKGTPAERSRPEQICQRLFLGRPHEPIHTTRPKNSRLEMRLNPNKKGDKKSEGQNELVTALREVLSETVKQSLLVDGFFVNHDWEKDQEEEVPHRLFPSFSRQEFLPR